MNAQLSKAQVERYFVAALDEALTPTEIEQFEAALADDPALKVQFEKYRSAVTRLKGSAREKAPEALSSMILRRTRRRRFQFRDQHNQLAWRVPAEVVISVLLAALVLLFMLLASP